MRVFYTAATVIAVLSGCAGSPSLAPMSPSQQNTRSSTAANGALLYVSDSGSGTVYFYTYPQLQPAGQIGALDFNEGICADPKGDVFVADTDNSTIEEYAHGGITSIATLSDANEYPAACAVDSLSGNLAVANICNTTSCGPGDIAIYDKATGTPKSFSDPSLHDYAGCTYDGSGNLFVGAEDRTDSPLLVELPKGQKTFETIHVTGVKNSGSPQWDGSHIVVEGSLDSYATLYRLKISGRKASVIGSTTLQDGAVGYFIDGTRVAAASAAQANVSLYKYPAGGAPLKTIGGLSEPVDVVVSR